MEDGGWSDETMRMEERGRGGVVDGVRRWGDVCAGHQHVGSMR